MNVRSLPTSPSNGPPLPFSSIVPLSHPTLTVIPVLPEIAEGDHLFLICGVKGTPPITFKWYRDDSTTPIFTTTSDMNNTDYQIQALAKDDSGTYYCEAINHAKNVVRSAPVTIVGEENVYSHTISYKHCGDTWGKGLAQPPHSSEGEGWNLYSSLSV